MKPLLGRQVSSIADLFGMKRAEGTKRDIMQAESLPAVAHKEDEAERSTKIYVIVGSGYIYLLSSGLIYHPILIDS